MSEQTKYIIAPWDAEVYVENLQTSKLEDIGTKGWLEFHKKLILLNLQSVHEISALQEESIKEWFVSLKKIPILIYEAVQIDIWKHKVFPYLIEINGEPENTFMLFSIFYHEDIAVSLLENVLFHCESAETMDDSVHDLIDYAVNYVRALLDLQGHEIYESTPNPNSCLEEILTKKKELEFDISIRCISIIRYLAEFLDNLPLSVLNRMLITHDVPCLLVQLIENRPWKKEDSDGITMIYNGAWKKVKESEMGKICKAEAQVWFGLRQLLLNPKCAPYYEISEHRISQLVKKHLHEEVLDQISPLVELKVWLSYLDISSHTGASRSRIVNVEIMPPIKISILEKHHNKWKKLAKQHAKLIFTKDKDYIKHSAQILSEAYDLDKLDFINIKDCCLCKETAKNRCSRCKEAWYCGRECQVKDWERHKIICDKIVDAIKNEST